MLSADDLLKVDPLIKPDKKYQANPDADINAMLAALMGGAIGSSLSGNSNSNGSGTSSPAVPTDATVPQNANGDGGGVSASVGDAATAGVAGGQSAAVGNAAVGAVAGLIGSVIGVPGIVTNLALNAITSAQVNAPIAAEDPSAFALDPSTIGMAPPSTDNEATSAVPSDTATIGMAPTSSNDAAVAAVADAVDGNPSAPAASASSDGNSSSPAGADAIGDSADGGGGGGGGGSCYLTTAILIATGRGDDADELRIMRKWRDEYARRYCPGLLTEYYRTAPAIVDAINDRKDAKEQWSKMYTDFLQDGVAAVFVGDNDLALNIYMRLVAHCKDLAEKRA